MSERDPWLTEREAANELRVSAYTVRQEREAGRLGHAKLRSRVFYPMSMIDAYRETLKCPAKSTSGDTPLASAGTSHGLRTGVRAAAQRGREIALKQKQLGRLSS